MGNKMVEPSGNAFRPSRSVSHAREDAARDEFDVILGWREDRLYRGLRSMLTVLETVQDYKIEILLAKENFDFRLSYPCLGSPDGIGRNERAIGNGGQSTTESGQSKHRARPLRVYSYR